MLPLFVLAPRAMRRRSTKHHHRPPIPSQSTADLHSRARPPASRAPGTPDPLVRADAFGRVQQNNQRRNVGADSLAELRRVLTRSRSESCPRPELSVATITMRRESGLRPLRSLLLSPRRQLITVYADSRHHRHFARHHATNARAIVHKFVSQGRPTTGRTRRKKRIATQKNQHI